MTGSDAVSESSAIRVVICTDGVFPDAMGGMQRHSRLLAQHLAEHDDVHVTVLHPHGKQVFDGALGIAEVFIRPIDTGKFYLRELWRYSERISNALDRTPHDVVLSQGFCVWKNMHRYRDQLILHPHGLEMFQGISLRERAFGWPFRAVLRYMARRSRFVISLGGRLTPVLQGLTAGSSASVVTVPNAVEMPAMKVPYEPVGKPLRLLFVGRFAFNKGLDVLMRVAKRSEEEGRVNDIRFELAGDGPLLASYKAMGLPKNVTLLGRVDDDRLFQLYTECDALVLPTRFEGMPTVVLEAMARSRPIFVSDVGATAELVDGHNGALLPKGDAEALYRAIIAFDAAPLEQRRAMADASYRRAAQRFDWSAVTLDLIRLFRKIKPAP